jgi:hypothetical protein
MPVSVPPLGGWLPWGRCPGSSFLAADGLPLPSRLCSAAEGGRPSPREGQFSLSSEGQFLTSPDTERACRRACLLRSVPAPQRGLPRSVRVGAEALSPSVRAIGGVATWLGEGALLAGEEGIGRISVAARWRGACRTSQRDPPPVGPRASPYPHPRGSADLARFGTRQQPPARRSDASTTTMRAPAIGGGASTRRSAGLQAAMDMLARVNLLALISMTSRAQLVAPPGSCYERSYKT